MAGGEDPSGYFVLWEETETLALLPFPCMTENQGNETSLNLQALLHRDERKGKTCMPFSFILSRQGQTNLAKIVVL